MTISIPKPKHVSLQIPKNAHGRQLVIPDIHGCLLSLKALLDKVKFSKHDQLFLLGDYIDKGTNSVGVLDLLIELRENDYQIFALQGNHEEMLLEKHHRMLKKNYTTAELLLPHLRKNHGIVDGTRKILPKYYDFICNMPYFYELENHFLVHAGFNLSIPNPFIDFTTMLWVRDFGVTTVEQKRIFNNKTVIFGHNPTFLQFIEQDILEQRPAICLDNGCVFSSKHFLGNLLCLDLETMQLVIQQNIDN